MHKRIAAIAALALAAACSGGKERAVEETPAISEEPRIETVGLDDVAIRFVKLALGIALHDKDFVDAYHGPPEWAQAVADAAPDLDTLAAEADELLALVAVFTRDGATAREDMLRKQIIAAQTRIRMTKGETIPFDIETQLLYDAVAPVYNLADFDAALAAIDAILPGTEPLNERVDAFRNALAIPDDKVDAVMRAAMDACRERTLAHYTLPAGETFSLSFVTDKSWSGYNWYEGGFRSRIEINTDLPVIIDRALDLGCHEGYPGHHTWNVLVERDFLRGQGWVEYSVYPLFGPSSLIAEGSANYGIALAFPGAERVAFERDVLFPLAGLDPAKADMLDRLNVETRRLSHARNHVAREYLDGRIDRERAISLLMTYQMTSRARAEQSVRFIETYRGYVLNYNLGRDIVEAYINARIDEGMEPWSAFEQLLTTPMSASDLVAASGR